MVNVGNLREIWKKLQKLLKSFKEIWGEVLKNFENNLRKF